MIETSPGRRFVGHTENTQLLQIGGEETGIGELEDDISQAIVPKRVRNKEKRVHKHTNAAKGPS